jgi:uncharacterized membrane protein YdjX (TVP38/TMEM64 family)
MEIYQRGGSKGAEAKLTSMARNRKRVSVSLATLALSTLAYHNRVGLAKVLNRKEIQASALRVLTRIQEHPPLVSLSMYALGLAVWDALGLNSVPVETAAGMAFGWSKGLIGSTLGRIMGGFLAFFMGRFVISEWVHSQLKDNAVLKLVETYLERRPLRGAILFKYSCFPGFIKNYGSGILDPIKPWMFLLACIISSLPFTIVWTFLGVDAEQRMRNPSLPSNVVLHGALVAAGVVNFVVAPFLMAWWIKDMKQSTDAG